MTQPVDHTSIPMSVFRHERPTALLLTDFGCVVGGTEYQFWSTIVARTDVRHIRLIFNQNLSAAKVTQLQYPCVWVQQEILRFNISMANSLRVDVRERTKELVDVNLDFEDRHGGLHLVKEA